MNVNLIIALSFFNSLSRKPFLLTCTKPVKISYFTPVATILFISAKCTVFGKVFTRPTLESWTTIECRVIVSITPFASWGPFTVILVAFAVYATLTQTITWNTFRPALLITPCILIVEDEGLFIFAFVTSQVSTVRLEGRINQWILSLNSRILTWVAIRDDLATRAATSFG